MKNIRNKLLAVTAVTLIALPLAACQTTTPTQSTATIDEVLAKAAADSANRGDSRQSLALLEKAYKRNSKNPTNALQYAAALRDAGRLARAEMILSPLVHDTDNAALLTEYAAVKSSMGQYDSAEEYARKAVLLDTEYGHADHLLGIALDAQAHHKQAEVAFRKALDHWAGDPAPVLNNLGLNLAAQGFIDEALDTLRKAAAVSPNRKEIERNIRIVSALQASPTPITPESNE